MRDVLVVVEGGGGSAGSAGSKEGGRGSECGAECGPHSPLESEHDGTAVQCGVCGVWLYGCTDVRLFTHTMQGQ